MRFIKNCFIPNKENEYYPYSIRKKQLITYVVFMFVFNVFASGFLSKLPGQALADTIYSSSDVIALANEDRSNAGVTLLNESSKLDSAASAKSADMFKYQYWAHDNPTTGATPWSFITASG